MQLVPRANISAMIEQSDARDVIARFFWVWCYAVSAHSSSAPSVIVILGKLGANELANAYFHGHRYGDISRQPKFTDFGGCYC